MKKKSLNNNYISFRYTYYCHISFRFAKPREFQSCGFGGLWRFAGNFTKSNSNAENVELFSNALEALVETCLPVDETEEARYLLSFLTRTLIIIHLYDIFQYFRVNAIRVLNSQVIIFIDLNQFGISD